MYVAGNIFSGGNNNFNPHKINWRKKKVNQKKNLIPLLLG